MNIEVYNIGAIPKHKVHATIASILHSGQHSQPTEPINFHFQVFQGPSNQNLYGLLTLPDAGVGRRLLKDYGGEEPRRCITVERQHLLLRASREVLRWGLVKHLRRTSYVAPQPLERRSAPKIAKSAPAVAVQAVQFGWETRDGYYSVEYEHEYATSSLWYDALQRRFTVKTVHADKTLLIVIRASHISWASYGTDDTASAIFFLALQYPPSYESAISFRGAARARYTALNDRHEAYTPFTSLTLRLVCSEGVATSALRQYCSTAQLRHHRFVHPVVYRALFEPSLQVLCQRWFTNIKFEIAFQLDCMARNNILDLYELLSLRPIIHNMEADEGTSYVVDFLQELALRLREDPSQEIIDVYGSCREEFVHLNLSTNSRFSPDTFWCYHAIVTPSTCMLVGPYLEKANRVIRQYPGHASNFLRVSFAEEDRLQYRLDREVDGRAFVHRRVGGMLKKGLTVAGRHFKFLAYSQSGLKSHSVYFVKDFDMYKDGRVQSVTAESIIADLGSFADIAHDPGLLYCPARYGARISQAFTTTDAAAIMEPDEILIIPDIYDPTGKRSFTDGVGTISPGLAEEIWVELQRTNPRRAGRNRPCPRAYQIRFGGSKGMLSVDYRLKDREICIRESMIKFQSNHRQIEVASIVDHPGKFCLNRPLIMVLEALGAAGGYEYLKKLQEVVIRDTREASRYLDTAARLFEVHGLGASYRLTSVFLGLHKLGFDMLPDKFIGKILKYAVYHILRELKHHARIPVPGGYTLVGVADVHRYLREGEVFACVLLPGETEPKWLEGRMLIARSPVIHPGDVQVVHAIGRPPQRTPYDIEPLTNTVVFSVQGSRPLASCLAGGDLDGDCFVCTTNEEMLPPKTSPPAEYNPAKRKILKRPATREDIIDFIVEYIYSDNIGIIATNWLITADHSTRGIFDPACLALAELHSDAADYPKTGLPVPMHLIPPMNFKERPDWSESELHSTNKGTRNYYKSQRWLGKLYRDVELPDLPEHRGQSADKVDNNTRAITLDDFWAYLKLPVSSQARDLFYALQRELRASIPTATVYRGTAVQELLTLFSVYTRNLRQICVNNSLSGRNPLDEAEVVVGTILEKTSQPRARKDYMSQMRELATDLVGDVRDQLVSLETSSGYGDKLSEHLECLRRSWIAYRISNVRPLAFGSQSFRLIALGQFFESTKHIEEIEANLQQHMGAA